MQCKKEIDIKNIIMESVGTVIGAFVMAIGVAVFLLPNQLSSGGISGIATLTYYLFNIPMGKMIIFINTPLFIFSAYQIGKRFFIKSIIGTISFSLFIDILDKLTPVPLTTDKFLASVYGGIIIGVGTAILLKVHASTGGSDLISHIAKKYNPAIRSSHIIIIIDIIIVMINMIIFKEIEIGLYSAIAIYLMGKIIDILFEGIYYTKLMIIVSNKSEEIAKEIEKKVERGATGLYGKGMYTNEEKLVLMCAGSRGDIVKIKSIVKKIDSCSFIIITNSREVVGLGFKKH